jgi:hypothetical protein
MKMPTMKCEIAFIDRRVDDLDTLLAGIPLRRRIGAEAATGTTGQK